MLANGMRLNDRSDLGGREKRQLQREPGRFVKRRPWEQTAVEECTIDLDVAEPR